MGIFQKKNCNRTIFFCGLLALAGFSCSRSYRTQKALEERAETIGAPATLLQTPSTKEMSGQGPFRSSKWFTLIWQERRLYAWERRYLDKGAVVFVGDSIIHCWAGLDRAFPNFQTANRGISGDTTRGVLYRFDEDVLKLQPRAVILLCGINDLGDGATTDQVVQNIQSLILLSRNMASNMPLVVCNILPVGADREDINHLIQELNCKLKVLAGEKTNVFIADSWSALASTNGVAGYDVFPDLTHPNESGYAKLAKCLQPILEHILNKK